MRADLAYNAGIQDLSTDRDVVEKSAGPFLLEADFTLSSSHVVCVRSS